MPSCPPTLTAEDRVEILALTSRYAHALDSRAWDQLAQVFAPDATMEFAGLPPATGPEAIAEVCSNALSPLKASQHLVGSPLVDITEDSVMVSSYFQAQHVRALDWHTALFIVAGAYEDRVEHRPEGWRIVHRQQTVSWQSGDSRVLGDHA